MKNTQFTISVPKHCHESWEEMTPAEKGRYCQSCQKTVTDFSSMSDQELISVFTNTREKICGRFHPGQLNRAISLHVYTRRRPLISIAAMVAALSIVIPPVQAKGKIEKIQMTPDRSDVTPARIAPDTISHITGIVRDENNAAVPGARVKIKGQEAYTRADGEGKFQLRIPAGFVEKSLTLQIQSIGMMSKEIVVPMEHNKRTPNTLVLNINIEQMVLGEAVGGIPHKLTRWQLIKFKVRRLFR